MLKYLQLTFSNETTYLGDEIGQAIDYNCITFLVISESKGIVRFDQHALDNALLYLVYLVYVLVCEAWPYVKRL